MRGLTRAVLLFVIAFVSLGTSFRQISGRIRTSSQYLGISSITRPAAHVPSATRAYSAASSIPSRMEAVKRVDPIAFIGASAKIAVSSTAGLVILFNSSWAPLYYILGGVANAVLSKLLKNTLRMPRPNGSRKDGYGMPSSHAQALFYFFAVLAAVAWRDLSHSSPLPHIITLALGGYAFMASTWRVSTGLHTTAQTVVGAILGTTIGLIVTRSEALVLKHLPASGVPATVKAPVLLAGFLVLYFREMKKALRRKHANK